MADTAPIPRRRPDNKGLDYVYLREKGVRLLQRLSADIWTDYNEHDPGVTTLEQLCYALTELSYRAELPFADLFAGTDGNIEPRRHGMFVARRILPSNPVTVNDYRKLISDRVPEARNVWLTPRIPPEQSDQIQGLYDIHVYVSGKPEWDNEGRDGHVDAKLSEILDRVRHVYCRYRNLCEDVHSIRMLLPLRTVVHADVSIETRMSGEVVLANILFAIESLLAPELPREPLDSLVKAGEQPSEIFNGPLLHRGFVPDSALQPKASSIAVNDIIGVIAQTNGVVDVRNVGVRTGAIEGEFYRSNVSIPVPADRYLRLDSRSHADHGNFTIRMTRNGKLYTPDAEAVERELRLLWIGYRRSCPLEAQYEEYFGVPSGQRHDLSHYYSIQNQYPDFYGIGAFGLPPDATVERRAQARQFKGYLLPFEQLMADYFAQLAHVGELFSIAPENWRTYYWQSLAKSVPNVEPILAPGYERGLGEIVSDGDQVVERRNRFLNFLLSLYANELHADDDGASTSRTHTRDGLIRAKLAFIQLLVTATRSRGRAFDYSAPSTKQNFAGMEIKCRIEIGIDVEEHQPLGHVLGKSGFSLASDASKASIGHVGNRRAEFAEESLQPLKGFSRPENVPQISSILKGNSGTEEFIHYSAEIDTLYIARVPGEGTVVVVSRTIESGWIVVDSYDGIEIAVAEAYAFFEQMRLIRKARTQLYIVEHNLLRFGRRPTRKSDSFPYSFTLTAVVSLPSGEAMNHDNRTAVEEVIRENTPSDTEAQVCFLDPWSLMKFESLNDAWRNALRRGHRLAVALTSARLRIFLESHRETTSTPRT